MKQRVAQNMCTSIIQAPSLTLKVEKSGLNVQACLTTKSSCREEPERALSYFKAGFLERKTYQHQPMINTGATTIQTWFNQKKG